MFKRSHDCHQPYYQEIFKRSYDCHQILQKRDWTCHSLRKMLASVFSKLLYPNPCPQTPLTQCAEKKRNHVLFPLPAMIKGVIFTHSVCSHTQHTHQAFQSTRPFFLTLLFYLRDNVKGIEHCDWIMVSCCKINASAFIENKCWRKAKTFILKYKTIF